METSHYKNKKNNNFKNISQKENFVESISEMAEEVWDFHNRFGLGSGKHQKSSPIEIIEKRTNILDEEIDEMFEAIKNKDDKETLLELADILFVVMGHVESVGNSGIEAVKDITIKNSHKTLDKYAIRPDTGKLLPLEGKPHKWQ